MSDNEQSALMQEYTELVKAYADALKFQHQMLQALDNVLATALDTAGGFYGIAVVNAARAQRRWKDWYLNHAGQFRQLAHAMQQIERRYGFNISPSPSPVPSKADAIKSVLKTSKLAD